MRLLEVQDLKLYYSASNGIVKAVDDVSFSIGDGETLGIVGESGCGKTSLALAIIRLLPRNVDTYKGTIRFDGTDLMKLSEEEFREEVRWKKISMVFQGSMNSLNPVIKVGYQVAEPLLLEKSADKREVYSRAIELMENVGLPREVFDRYPHELSGGMKQRIAIAMSLILEPELVIMDEPTSALDVSVQAQIMNLLKRLKKMLGLSILFITHDLALASEICDRIAVMYGGRVVEIGSAERILTAPLHPYTRRLLDSVPRIRSFSEPAFIPGVPPDLINPPSGCLFHPRCQQALEACEKSPPPLHLNRGHMVRCWLYQEGSKG